MNMVLVLRRSSVLAAISNKVAVDNTEVIKWNVSKLKSTVDIPNCKT